MGLFKPMYDKEGPGISKNAPKKKTFIIFFETFFRNFWKFIPINLVYTVLCFPILTHGIAAAGITNVARNTARDKHSFGLSDFFETIKKNFKQGLSVGILNTLITGVLIFVMQFYFNSYNQAGSVVSLFAFAISVSIVLIFVMMNFYIYTLMITFSYKIKTLYVNSFRFAIINLKKNFLCVGLLLLIAAVFIGIFLLIPQIIVFEIIFASITIPAFVSLMVQYLTFPAIKKYIIDPYYAEHPDEDIEKRRSLGLDVDTEENDDSDFNDERLLPTEENK